MGTSIGSIRVSHCGGGYNTGVPAQFRIERFEPREIRGQVRVWWYGVESGFASYKAATERAAEIRAQGLSDARPT